MTDKKFALYMVLYLLMWFFIFNNYLIVARIISFIGISLCIIGVFYYGRINEDR